MKIVNAAHLIANLLLLAKVLHKLFTSGDLQNLTYEAGVNTLADEIYILKFLQLAQLTDFVFSSGDKFSIFLQLTSRISLPWIFMLPTTSSMSLYICMICWTIADSVRYTFYLVKGGLISALRYNMFIVLYPLGVAHEFMIVKSFFDVYKQDAFPEWQYYFAWAYDIGLFAGLPFLYTYMLSSRKRYYKKLRAQQATPKQKSN